MLVSKLHLQYIIFIEDCKNILSECITFKSLALKITWAAYTQSPSVTFFCSTQSLIYKTNLPSVLLISMSNVETVAVVIYKTFTWQWS